MHHHSLHMVTLLTSIFYACLNKYSMKTIMSRHVAMSQISFHFCHTLLYFSLILLLFFQALVQVSLSSNPLPTAGLEDVFW